MPQVNDPSGLSGGARDRHQYGDSRPKRFIKTRELSAKYWQIMVDRILKGN